LVKSRRMSCRLPVRLPNTGPSSAATPHHAVGRVVAQSATAVQPRLAL
jgi:hypothetical protein